jgi:hypothetical protein
MSNGESNAERSLVLCSLFESEILVWLLLRHWQHPYSEDMHFRSGLLESATEVLASARDTNQVFVEGVPAKDMNLVAALWYAESCALADSDSMISPTEHALRVGWLDSVKRSLPSCFCSQDLLG